MLKGLPPPSLLSPACLLLRTSVFMTHRRRRIPTSPSIHFLHCCVYINFTLLPIILICLWAHTTPWVPSSQPRLAALISTSPPPPLWLPQEITLSSHWTFHIYGCASRKRHSEWESRETLAGELLENNTGRICLVWHHLLNRGLVKNTDRITRDLYDETVK